MPRIARCGINQFDVVSLTICHHRPRSVNLPTGERTLTTQVSAEVGYRRTYPDEDTRNLPMGTAEFLHLELKGEVNSAAEGLIRAVEAAILTLLGGEPVAAPTEIPRGLFSGEF
jgi:hypothetical protein